MTRLVLVRHADPFVDARTPPGRWPLTDKGRDKARSLGRLLAGGSATTVVWTSSERKAQETAALACPSVPHRVRNLLDEVKRPWYAGPEELADAVRSYLRGGHVEGWERRAEVIARLAQLKADFPPSAHLIVVTHGVLLTTWLDHEVGLDDPFSFWSNLQMPDAWEIEPAEKTLRRLT